MPDMYGLPHQVWSYRKRTFAHDNDIPARMYVMETIPAAKLFDAAPKGMVAAKVVISTPELRTYG